MKVTEEIKHIMDRFDKAKAVRANYEHVWEDISEFVRPYKGNFTRQQTAGQRRDRRLYDNTAQVAAEKLASTYYSGLTNIGTKWFELSLDGPEANDPEVKRYLNTVSERMLKVFGSHRFGFPRYMHELYMDYISYGTGAMFIDTPKAGNISFRTYHLSEIYALEDYNGAVDTVFRKFELTVRQAVQEFGIENVHPLVRKYHNEKKFDEKVQLLHVVAPREDHVKGSKQPKKLPISSIYIDIDNNHKVKESGYHEMPYIVPRFAKVAGETYGYSPSWTALSTILRVNIMTKTAIIAAEKTVDPTLIVNDESVMLPITTVPGGIIYGNFEDGGRPPVQPLVTGGDISTTLNLIQVAQQEINETFFADQLVLPELDRATAEEVKTRNADRLRLLGPQLARFQAEALRPMIDRVFGIMLRANAFPDAPEVLQGKNIDVEYLGPLAKLQKSNINDSIVRTMGGLAPLLQLDPSVLDNFDIRETAKIFAENAGFPMKAIRSQEEVSAIRQEKQQQEQQALLLQQLQQGSEAVKNVGQSGFLDEGDENV